MMMLIMNDMMVMILKLIVIIKMMMKIKMITVIMIMIYDDVDYEWYDGTDFKAYCYYYDDDED